jgi:hypothetical protein
MKRWEKAVQPQIPKDKELLDSHESAESLSLKLILNLCVRELFGQQLMTNAEKH